jgi:hypothetical protein
VKHEGLPAHCPKIGIAGGAKVHAPFGTIGALASCESGSLGDRWQQQQQDRQRRPPLLASEARATYDTYPSSGKGEHSSKADHCECLEKVRDEEWEVFLAWRLLPCLFVRQ